jgi:HEPN domain-containing protein
MSETYQREWVQKAEEDYQAALALSRLRKRPTPNAVSFHCQQCAEKYLKAFLVSKDGRVLTSRIGYPFIPFFRYSICENHCARNQVPS